MTQQFLAALGAIMMVAFILSQLRNTSGPVETDEQRDARQY